MSFIKKLPDEEALLKEFPSFKNNIKLNGHIHTPYSFSAFDTIEQAFTLAQKENIQILGINDFYVTDGYEDFYNLSLQYKIFPLFNIEFIGLLKEEQKNNFKVNDPSNPGRTYFSGKALSYPVSMSNTSWEKIRKVREESQQQVKEMINKTNSILSSVNSPFSLGFDNIKKELAKELVRERHIAKALRIEINKHFSSDNDKLDFVKKLYGNKDPKAALNDNNSFEGELRSRLLKAGGAAFVEEDENAFLPVDEIIEIIKDAGGIPCYPVLLDDPNGNYTDFEGDFERLYKRLSDLNVSCIELIPGRNDIEKLREFVLFFDRRNFVITFGTEHNTPELIPLTITARGITELDDQLNLINYKGACVIAAHQYLKAREKQGFLDETGKARIKEKSGFEVLGNAVIRKFLS